MLAPPGLIPSTDREKKGIKSGDKLQKEFESCLELAEEVICKLKDKAIQMMKPKEQKGKKVN